MYKMLKKKACEDAHGGEGERLLTAAVAGIILSVLVMPLEYFKVDAICGTGIYAIIFASSASGIFITFIMPRSGAAKAGKFIKSHIGHRDNNCDAMTLGCCLWVY
jgi:hypothetical protein